jgi:hypothetical protein
MEVLGFKMPAAGLVGTVKPHTLIAVTDLRVSPRLPTQSLPTQAKRERRARAVPL